MFGVVTLAGSPPPAHAAEGTVAITSTSIDKVFTWAGDTVVVSFSYACNGAGGDECTGVTATIPAVTGTDVFGAPFGPVPAIAATTTTHLDSWGQTGAGDVVFTASNPLPAGATGNVTVTYRTFGTSVPDGTVHTFTPQISSTANTATGTSRAVELEAIWSWYAYHGFHSGTSYPDNHYHMVANWCPNNRSGPTSGALYLPGAYLELVIKHPDVVVVSPGGSPELSATVTTTPTEVRIRWEPTAFFEGCTGTGYTVRFPSSAFVGGESVEFELNAYGPGGSLDPAANTNGPLSTLVSVVPPPPPTVSGYKNASGPYVAGSTVEWYLNVVVDGGLPADDVTIVDAVPAGQELVSFKTGTANTPGVVTVEYSTDGGSSWTPVPDSPFDRMSWQDVDASTLPAGITHLRWNFGTIAPYSIPGTRVVTRIPSDAATGSVVTNCEQVFAEFEGAPLWGGHPGLVSDYCHSITVQDPTVRPAVQIQPPFSVAAGTNATVTVRGLNNGSAALASPRYSVVLPPGFTYVAGSARPSPGVHGPSAVPEPTIGTHPDYPGQQWLTFDPLADPIPVGSPGRQELDFDVTVPPFDYTETPQFVVWLGSTDPGAPLPVTVCDPAYQTTPDSGDWDVDGQTDDIVCRASAGTSTPRTVAADADHDGSGDGGSTWVNVIDGAPGDVVELRANLRSASTTDLGATDLVWILPALGDEQPQSDTPRSSEFTVPLTAPVSVDQPADVEYSTSADPCRGEIGGPDAPGVSCDAPDWQPWGVHPAGDVRSVRIRLTAGLPIGESVSAVANVALPDESTLVSMYGPAGAASAWSSYAFRSTVSDTGDLLDGDSQTVELRVAWDRTSTTTPSGDGDPPVSTSVPGGGDPPPSTSLPGGGDPSTSVPGGGDPPPSTSPDPGSTTPSVPSGPGVTDPGSTATTTPSTPGTTVPGQAIDRLPTTGASQAAMLLLGAMLVGAGCSLLVTSRRPRPT